MYYPANTYKMWREAVVYIKCKSATGKTIKGASTLPHVSLVNFTSMDTELQEVLKGCVPVNKAKSTGWV